MEDERITEVVEKIHRESPDNGYRRIRDDLSFYHGIEISDKKALRICRAKGIKSTIKYGSHGCTRNAKNPQHIEENILDRNLKADKPNEKWLTDVTEFKYYVGIVVHKIFLSVILDLYDRRVVAYRISDRNDNTLVIETFDRAVRANPIQILYSIAIEGFSIQTEYLLEAYEGRYETEHVSRRPLHRNGSWRDSGAS